jgi:hypothetical protein
MHKTTFCACMHKLNLSPLSSNLQLRWAGLQICSWCAGRGDTSAEDFLRRVQIEFVCMYTNIVLCIECIPFFFTLVATWTMQSSC